VSEVEVWNEGPVIEVVALLGPEFPAEIPTAKIGSSGWPEFLVGPLSEWTDHGAAALSQVPD